MDVAIEPGTVQISGQFTSGDDAARFGQLVDVIDPTEPLVIDVSSVTWLSETGYRALHRLADRHPAPVTVVCSDVMLLCELQLTDLSDVARLQAHAWLTVSQPQQAA